jgi:hypothetical protein
MLDLPRHSMSEAAAISGLSTAQFSRLLSGHPDLAKSSLEQLVRSAAKSIEKPLQPLLPKSPWKILSDCTDFTLKSATPDIMPLS